MLTFWGACGLVRWGAWQARSEIKALQVQLDSLKCSDASGRLFDPRKSEFPRAH